MSQTTTHKTSSSERSHASGLLMAFAGILILSPDTLLVRLLDLPQWNLQFYRGLGMCLSIALGLAITNRGRTLAVFKAVGLAGILTALSFAAATILFVSALYLTSVANTLAIISTAPIFGALLSRLILKEALPLRTWLAAVGCVAAVSVIVGGDIVMPGQQPGQDSLLGDFLALVQAVFMAAAFVLVRSRKEVDMAPCMALSGLLAALISLPLGWGALAVPTDKLPMLLLLIVILLPGSFFLLLRAPRWVPAPEVNMIMLLEMVLGPLAVWLVVGEAVTWSTLAGGSLLFAILLLHSWLGLRSRRGYRKVWKTEKG